MHDIDNDFFYQVFNTYMTERDETESAIYNQIVELEAIELTIVIAVGNCRSVELERKLRHAEHIISHLP